MPEYLAPGVYVEEIDTGSKPIEGVSTSTAGMIGVTERGPINVPVLVTSYGEYVRWFGERLNLTDYGTHRFLPHAVEGFFTNRGKRLFVTRILELGAASLAATPLFLHQEGLPTATLLTRAASAISSVLFVEGTAASTIVANDWVRVGSGSDAEYRQATGAPVVSTTSVILNLPLLGSHAVPAPMTNNVQHYTALPAVAVPCTLAGDHDAGATVLTLTGGAGVVADRLIQIVLQAQGQPETNEELSYMRSVVDLGGGNWRVELDRALQLDHSDGEAVRVLNALPSPPTTETRLTRAAVSGDATLVVSNNAGFTTANHFVRVVEGTRGEFRRIGAVQAVSFGVPTTYPVPAGTYVEHVQRADTGGITAKTLDVPIDMGAMALPVNDRQGLQIGQILRVGAVDDPDVEYVVIRDLPNRAGSGPDPGRIVLETPLVRPHGGALPASRRIVAVQTITARAEAATVLHELSESSTSGFVTARLLAGALTTNDLMRIVLAGRAPGYQRLAAHTVRPVQELNFTAPLLQPHAAPQPIVERQQLMTVFALDPGIWGNRLRVAVQRETSPLVRTRIRNDASGIQDPIHIRLDAVTGVEVGTILSLADSQGIPIATPFKVEAIDRQNGYLLTLNTALPAAAVLGAAVVSIEFSMTIYLLRQSDAAQPIRNNQVLDVEVFRPLSLDSRHSRYIQRVVGTTWTPGNPNDDDGRPLRLADRRSEGESWYVRVRDTAQDLAEPDRTTALHSIRLGPEFLIDITNGRQVAARRALTEGDDQISTLTDAHYIGQDDPNPENRSGLHSLRNIEEISIVACPGQTSPQIQDAVINHCELMRYRFAVLDAHQSPHDTIADVQNQRQQFDTKYAALYHPWLLIPDPFPTNLAKIADYPIPPSGHVVGIYARTDIERGVHKAPANEVVRGIIGLQRVLNKEQQDILNPYPVNINVIRDFRDNNRSIRVFGGRVITSDSDWKYVNVRRLLIFIENSIDRGLQWVVFEPNAEPLWARVRRSISNFLTLVWRNGALEGTKPEEAYFVKCDRTTMTQTDIDSGRLIVVVGVAPVKPAEFVIIRIGLWTAQADN
jgi:phage tail sheath protein FI